MRFDLAVNKYPASQKVRNSICDKIDMINLYPETNWSRLVTKIADYNKVEEKQVLITNGLEEAIDVVSRAYLSEGEKVQILTPTYSQFSVAALRQRAEVMTTKLVWVENGGFDILAPSLIENTRANAAKLLWLCNPNNPTGTVFVRKKLASIIENLECIVAVDECFYEFCQETVVDMIGKVPNLIILRSFSKSFGLAGIRIGYIVADEEIIKYLLRLRQPSSVNVLAQQAALAALADLTYYRSIWDAIKWDRENLRKGLQLLGFKVYPSGTNFLYAEAKNAVKIYKELWKKRIAVFPGWDPEFLGCNRNCLRITVGLPVENTKLLNALKEII